MAGLWCQTALKQQDSHSLLCVIAVAPQSAERCMGADGSVLRVSVIGVIPV